MTWAVVRGDPSDRRAFLDGLVGDAVAQDGRGEV